MRFSLYAFQFIDTTQTVLTALMLAFIFRSFMVEAFIIPTGSMAQSLLGAHATRTCPACGWEFDFAPTHDCLCPNCHLRTPLPADWTTAKDGDRILVHKWPVAFHGLLGPRRWDVAVFRNPADPYETYIKRVVGLPGESVEIIDGDLFVNGEIARKTRAAQSVMWFIVFDQNHYPNASAPSASWPRWVPDADDAGGSEAGWSGFETRVLHYDGLDDVPRSIRFKPSDARYFQDVYAYGRGPSPASTPYVGDFRIVAEVMVGAGDGSLQWELTRNGRRFIAETHRSGDVSLTVSSANDPSDPGSMVIARVSPLRFGRPYRVEFGHVDLEAYLKIDDREVLRTTTASYSVNLDELRDTRRVVPVGLRVGAAQLDVALRGLRVDRDVYYTARPGLTQRAYTGEPFALSEDEYFVLGDNSPESRDSREWTSKGLHLPGDYRIGTVPADQIVGPAALVYLPGLLSVDRSGRWLLPDLGRVRFVR